MALPEFVSRRGERLYYRRAFPQELWPVTGTSPFSRSLRTNSPAEALRARPEAERLYHVRVDAARAELIRRSSARPINEADALPLALTWFREAVDDWAPQPSDQEELLRAMELEELAEIEAREALSLGHDKERTLGGRNFIQSLAGRLREINGLASSPAGDAALVKMLRRAEVAMHQVRAGRLVGDYGKRPDDPLFASALEAPQEQATVSPQATPHQTVSDLETAFRAARLPSLSPASQLAYAPVFRVLREIIGADTRLSSLTHDDGQRLFDTVRSIPTNAQKRAALKGRPLPDQIAEAKRLGLPTLAPKTINDRYLAGLGSLFRFARQRGWMAVNPMEGFQAREEVAAADRREPFGADRLKVLFGSSPWTPSDKGCDGKPIRYWGPLLALYHGLRLGEIAGLEVGHVATDGCQPMLLLRAGQRQLKTASARRDIPVHPEMLRLGFMGYVKERRKQAKTGELLFAGEAAYARQQWGRGLGDWFVRKVRSLKLEGRKLTFHSLRHDFRDALREAEVQGGLADYIMGHSQEGMGAQYGSSRPSLARLRGAMAKVGYTGLRL
jgi:hypothetical protein